MTSPPTAVMQALSSQERVRIRLEVRGAVQGVGFRPFVYRLATELGLIGWVSNTARGVSIEIEGDSVRVDEFLDRMEMEAPPHSLILQVDATWLEPVGGEPFQIQESRTDSSRKSAVVLPDLATCYECLEEVFDPQSRRYLYPFTNCTHCGPRYSIIEALPYDRIHTSMKTFPMCERCRAEYEDPGDRRFHAQPIACPDCGPQLEWWDVGGRVLERRGDARLAAVRAIRRGAIVAVKGLGGFHLVVDACQDDAVQRLRERKRRYEKPFALMFPTLDSVLRECNLSALETQLLLSSRAPIVLVSRRSGPSQISGAVAPRNPYLGVMLPYTPLHHLLLAEIGTPVIATSGNRSDEPICIDEREALSRLGGIADFFLVHHRPIVRHGDDSVVCVMAGREVVLRSGRGYAPTSLRLPTRVPPILAMGAHQKNAVALAVDHQMILSQHIGDLDSPHALSAFRRVLVDFEQLYDVAPALLAVDAHPDYQSTQVGTRRGFPFVYVQHHHAHVLSCLADHELAPPVLGVSWDGAGYGLDSTLWGGEFLRVREDGFDRVAHLRTFPLPGGEAAIREPRRAALGLLYELFGDVVFEETKFLSVAEFMPAELALLKRMLQTGVRSSVTSSMGRLFDAVASLAGLRQHSTFEGQAAMELEFQCNGLITDEAYPLSWTGYLLDWGPMMKELLEDCINGTSPARISARFHNGLVEGIVSVARTIQEEKVILTGGCFQNRYLTERAIERLRQEGFAPYGHHRIPPNDGGIAVGQILGSIQQSVMGNHRN